MLAYGKTLSGKIKYDSKFFKVKDVARRLDAGTGSLGTSRFYVLIEGTSKSNDSHILDVKHQAKPTAYNFLSPLEKQLYDITFSNDAEHQAMAYEAFSNNPDDFLGWMQFRDGFYSVREPSPFKETFDTSTLTKQGYFIKALGAIGTTNNQ